MSIVNLGTIIFFLVSLDVSPQSKSTPLAGFMVSILMQSTGHALSHCKHPIQSSISTCNLDLMTLYSSGSKPILLSGCGHFSFGYCKVATRSFFFLKCSRVKLIPEIIVLTASYIFAKY